ncbi:MAG: hypothetical protein AB7T49_17995 [Oligoflexales bacterium]
MKKFVLSLCFLGLLGTSCKQRTDGSEMMNSSDSSSSSNHSHQSETNDKRAVEAALMFYKTNAGDIQGSEPSAEIYTKRNSVGATVYLVDIQDQNEDGESWNVRLQVVVRMDDGEVTWIKHENYDLAKEESVDDEAHHAVAKTLAHDLFEYDFGNVKGKTKEGEVIRRQEQSSYRYTQYVVNISRDPGGDARILERTYFITIANNGALVLEIEGKANLGD